MGIDQNGRRGIPFPATLAVTFPPYSDINRIQACSWPAAAEARLGTVVLFDVLPPLVSPQQLRASVLTLRAECHTAPLVLRLPGEYFAKTVRIAFHARSWGIRAVIPSGPVDTEDLRRQMTDLADMSSHICEWFCLRDSVFPGRAVARLEDLFRRELEERHLRKSVRSSTVSDREAVRILRQTGYPNLRVWRKLARALGASLEIQAWPFENLSTIAAKKGYSDQASLSNQLKQVFGLRPTEIRGTLGWEWLLDRWMLLLNGVAIERGRGLMRNASVGRSSTSRKAPGSTSFHHSNCLATDLVGVPLA